MKHPATPHRPAIAALFAAIVLPTAPVFAQETPIASPPPIVEAPAPIVTTNSPPPADTTPPMPAILTAPPPVVTLPAEPQARAAAPARPTAVRTARAAPRTPPPVRRAAPVRVAPAEIPAPSAVAPPPALGAQPIPPPAALPVADSAPAVTAADPVGFWPWLLAGAALLIGAFALIARRRRRVAPAEYEGAYRDEPALIDTPDTPDVPDPLVAAPAALVADDPEEPAAADVEAMAAGSEPVAGRPWLEFLLRPVRAGTSQDDAIVQYELTVGNTGSLPATDVRVSTWMVAAGDSGEMERMLIDPPAGADVSRVDIAAGDGARVDGEIALSKADLGETETVLPVLVADARYRLPDGSEGRTHAAFAIGLPDGDGLTPFQVDRASGLFENVEARLHGEPERV